MNAKDVISGLRESGELGGYPGFSYYPQNAPHEEGWQDCLAVTRGDPPEVVTHGTREECEDYMRSNQEGRDWEDLMYARCRPGASENEIEIVLGRLSSWVL